MTTLFDVSGISARIFTLAKRPPFMIAADLAEVYGTSVSALNQAVSRNPDRFPEDFMFTLSEAETEALRSQNVTANTISTKARYEPKVFTHAGALMLSAVLKTTTAAAVSVQVHRAFAAMEAQAIADARDMVARVHVKALCKQRIYGFIALNMQQGLTLDQMRQHCSYPLWKLETAAREMLAMRLIDRLPKGMQPTLFDLGSHA